MKKILILCFVLIWLAACSQSVSLASSQTDKIQTLKDQIALLKQEQTTQKNMVLALNVKLDVYQSHFGVRDISEFTELYQRWFGTSTIKQSEVIYDSSTNQTTILMRYINASLSFKGRLPDNVKAYDTGIGISFYWVSETNVVQIFSYERFSKAVLNSSSLAGSVSLNDGTVLVKFVLSNDLTGSDSTVVSEFLSQQISFTVSN